MLFNELIDNIDSTTNKLILSFNLIFTETKIIVSKGIKTVFFNLKNSNYIINVDHQKVKLIKTEIYQCTNDEISKWHQTSI